MTRQAVLIITIFFASFVLWFPAFSYAQQSTASAMSTYVMPYPGLLPDSPFYFVKVARDNLFGFFISDPVKKATYELHQADKRIEASYLLATKKKKTELADSTYSKGLNYFEEALSKAHSAKQQGINIDELANTLLQANQKHIERGQTIMDQLDNIQEEQFTQELQRAKTLGKKAKELKPKK